MTFTGNTFTVATRPPDSGVPWLGTSPVVASSMIRPPHPAVLTPPAETSRRPWRHGRVTAITSTMAVTLVALAGLSIAHHQHAASTVAAVATASGLALAVARVLTTRRHHRRQAHHR